MLITENLWNPSTLFWRTPDCFEKGSDVLRNGCALLDAPNKSGSAAGPKPRNHSFPLLCKEGRRGGRDTNLPPVSEGLIPQRHKRRRRFGVLILSQRRRICGLVISWWILPWPGGMAEQCNRHRRKGGQCLSQASLPAAGAGEPRRAPEGPCHGQNGFGSFCRNKRTSSHGGETPESFFPLLCKEGRRGGRIEKLILQTPSAVPPQITHYTLAPESHQ